ncbi:TIR domain-containing protein [Neobacillus mesonae]|uniref:TIR domain-containing protein n=1 Tax=Neobacillus mesonae TaxID=1193713 RepID=UPI00203AE4ED|nr:TIR domain-containing protein [Neobacillus mesonae]MCM3570433.1 nucleotide-binding protein [Neobacillus mesonae]
MTKIKPKLFIGSAKESIEYVDAIHESLSHAAEVTPWSAGAFLPLEYNMETLERQLDENDFAVFVFSPDDVVNIRGTITFTTRDNTLFEMGLFWGRLRRGRVFYMIPGTIPENEEAKGFRLPSDLDGLTVLRYEIRSDNNYTAAVNVACRAIKRKIAELSFFKDPAKLLAEAQANMDKDYALIRILRTLSKRLLSDPSKKFEYLQEAVRNAYQAPDYYYVEAIGVWLAEGQEGLRQIAGNDGQGEFYPFHINETREDTERIVVIDCFLQSTELVFQKNSTAFDNTYVLCYPIGNQLVLTVAITGKRTLSQEEIDEIFLDNYNLLSTINTIFGGASL